MTNTMLQFITPKEVYDLLPEFLSQTAMYVLIFHHFQTSMHKKLKTERKLHDQSQ